MSEEGQKLIALISEKKKSRKKRQKRKVCVKHWPKRNEILAV